MRKCHRYNYETKDSFHKTDCSSNKSRHTAILAKDSCTNRMSDHHHLHLLSILP